MYNDKTVFFYIVFLIKSDIDHATITNLGDDFIRSTNDNIIWWCKHVWKAEEKNKYVKVCYCNILHCIVNRSNLLYWFVFVIWEKYSFSFKLEEWRDLQTLYRILKKGNIIHTWVFLYLKWLQLQLLSSFGRVFGLKNIILTLALLLYGW